MEKPVSYKGYDFSSLSYAVIGSCHDVQRQLGVHCMEVDYQRALEIALSKRGLSWQREVEIPIAYDSIVVTTRRVDFIIEDGNEWHDFVSLFNRPGPHRGWQLLTASSPPTPPTSATRIKPFPKFAV